MVFLCYTVFGSHDSVPFRPFLALQASALDWLSPAHPTSTVSPRAVSAYWASPSFSPLPFHHPLALGQMCSNSPLRLREEKRKKERCAATVEFLLANEDPKWYWIQLEAKWVFFSLNARRSRAYFLRWNNMSWRTLKSDNETSPDVQIQKVRSLVSLVSWHGSTFVA